MTTRPNESVLQPNLSEHLFAAIGKGNLGLVKLLIIAGVDVNETTIAFITPLHYASSFGFLRIVERLVARGADMDAQDQEGITALHYASLRGHSETVKFLLAHNANTQLRDRWHNTALEVAIDWKFARTTGLFRTYLEDHSLCTIA